MVKYWFPVFILIAALAGSDRSYAVEAASQPSGDEDAINAGLAALRQIEGRFAWSSMEAEIKMLSKAPHDGKTLYDGTDKVRMTIAGDHFRIFTDCQCVGHNFGPPHEITYDGTVLKSLGIPRNSKETQTLGITDNPDLLFTDLYYYWPFLGTWKFSERIGLADRIDELRKEKCPVAAEWIDGKRGIRMTFTQGDLWEAVQMGLDGGGHIEDYQVRTPDCRANDRVTETSQVDGIILPKKIEFDSESSKEMGTIVCTFSSLHCDDPAKAHPDELTAIREEPGMEVVDGIAGVAYRVLPNGGRDWLPFFNPLTGKVTWGPVTRP